MQQRRLKCFCKVQCSAFQYFCEADLFSCVVSKKSSKIFCTFLCVFMQHVAEKPSAVFAVHSSEDCSHIVQCTTLQWFCEAVYGQKSSEMFCTVQCVSVKTIMLLCSLVQYITVHLSIECFCKDQFNGLFTVQFSVLHPCSMFSVLLWSFFCTV